MIKRLRAARRVYFPCAKAFECRGELDAGTFVVDLGSAQTHLGFGYNGHLVFSSQLGVGFVFGFYNGSKVFEDV
jgi:hypothetical protein